MPASDFERVHGEYNVAMARAIGKYQRAMTVALDVYALEADTARELRLARLEALRSETAVPRKLRESHEARVRAECNEEVTAAAQRKQASEQLARSVYNSEVRKAWTAWFEDGQVLQLANQGTS